MLRKNLARCSLLLRHVFTYTPALISHKRKACTNKFDFLLPPDPDGRLSVIYFCESFESSFHPVGNYQKLSETRPETRRHGELLLFLSK